MTDPIGTIQGIFKWEAQEYTELDTIKRTVFDRSRNIFYAINFAPGFGMVQSGQDVLTSVIIDIIYDDGKKSKTLITDPQKVKGGIVMPYVTDYPGEVVWLGYFEVPGYDKYITAGEHTVTIKVAPRKLAQYFRGRDFSPEAGGVTGVFKFNMVDDRPQGV